MKILWFTHTPCRAAEKLSPNLNVGGWQKSLEEQLVQVNNIELSVGFYWGEEMEPFNYKGTTFYPIYKKGEGSKAGRLINRVLKLNDDKADVKQLLETVDKIKPDLIHVHGTESNFGLIQEFIDIPLVVSIQGIITAYVEKYYSGIPAANAVWHERLLPKLLFKSVTFFYNNMRKAAVRERKVFSQARFIFGRTDWDRRISKILAPSSTYYVSNEILRPTFYENGWKKTTFDNPLQLVTVMSGGLYKGFETVVKTAQILSDRKQFNFKWVVIGQTQSNDMIKIVQRWLKVNFKDLNIHLVGSKNEVEIVETLLQSDIYCQVSHIENSPNSLCEAMLLGMPIVASFAGGTDSMLENKKEGVLYQDGDIFSLAGAIVEMSQDVEQAVEYGANAKVKATMRHDKNNITTSLVESYQNILLKKTNK